MRGHTRSRGYIYLFFLILVLLYFWRLVTPFTRDRAIFINSDFNLQFYPWLKFAYEQWRHGHVPLWNPYINAGQPGLADIQMAALYPINLVVYALLALFRQPFTPDALIGITLLHFWLAAVFTYLLGRRVTGSDLGGIVAAVVYTFSGYMVLFASIQLSVLQTATWLPGVLLLADRAFLQGGRRNTLGLSVLLAIVVLAGHPQMFLYTVYAVLALALIRWYERRAASGLHPTPVAPLAIRLRGEVRIFGRLAAALAVAMGLAAVQLLPTAELFAHSHRAEQLNFHYTSAGLPPEQWAGFFLAGAVSDAIFFVGITALVLAAWGVWQRWTDARAWVLLGTLAFLLTLGGHTFVYPLFYILAPGFALFREQYRIVYVFILAIALLAGLGTTALTASWQQENREGVERGRRAVSWGAIVALAVGIVLHLARPLFPTHHGLAAVSQAWAYVEMALVALALILLGVERGRVRGRTASALLVGVLMLELFSPIWQRPLRDRPPEGIYPVTPLVQAMMSDPARPFRISSEGLLPGGPNSAIVYGLEDILGYTPLGLGYVEMLNHLPETKRWGMLNVRYVLTRRDFSGDGRFALVAEEGDQRVYRFGSREWLPRVFLTHRVQVVDPERVWERLASADLREVVLLEEPPHSPPAAPMGEDVVRLVTYNATKAVVQVRSASAGMLVFSEMYYPDWRAYVDGQRVPVYRADGVLRAVPVPAGDHRVEMVYRPRWFYVGTAISLLTGILVLAGIFFRPRQRHLNTRSTGDA